MFRSATTRLAHNSTVPSLAGAAGISKDLKALQDLINAEKSVMQTLQKLSADLAKAAELSKQWGSGEGDDLGDTLTASTSMFLHFASALSRFSQHEGAVREQMKAIRSREEKLDEVKRRRKSLVSKADASDKKLGKMSSENKNFQAQADGLNKLREEIRGLDTEILNEEASLGDFKRTTAKYWMGIKFGALMECCEKGMLVGELGKRVIEEIPLEPTEPGLPRPYYQGHARTEFLVAEAQRALNEVVFSVEPSQKTGSISIRPLPGSELPPLPAPLSLYDSTSTSGWTSSMSGVSMTENTDQMENRYSQSYLSPTHTLSTLPDVSSQLTESVGMHSFHSNDSQATSLAGHPSDPFASPRPTPAPLNTDVNEFGVYPPSGQFLPRTTSLRHLAPSEQPGVGGPRGPRFSTFPVKGPAIARVPPPSVGVPPVSYTSPQGLGDRAPSLEIDRRETASFSSSIALALGQEWAATGPPASPGTRKMQEARAGLQEQYSPPPPRYTITPETPSIRPHIVEPISQSVSSSSALSVEPHSAISDDSTSLAYVATEYDEHPSTQTFEPAYVQTSFDSRPPAQVSDQPYIGTNYDEHPSTQPSGHPSGHGDRHVRFGASDDDDPQPLENLGYSNNYTAPIPGQTDPATQQVHAPPLSSPPRTPNSRPLPTRLSSPPLPLPPSPTIAMPQPSATIPQVTISEQYPAPHSPQDEESEEKALNAAAAREVSRELDALMFNSPVRSPAVPAQTSSPVASPPTSPTAPLSPRVRSGLGAAPSSPTSSRLDLNYVRERDRPGSMPGSPVRSDHDHDRAVTTRRSPLAPSPSPTAHEYLPPQQPPPSISLQSPSLTNIPPSAESPYKTPSEFPLPPTPPAFYNLPSMSGSGSFSPGGTRTISAAAFKRPRPVPAPSSPPPGADLGRRQPDVNPLVINKRGLPGSPRISLDSPGASYSHSPLDHTEQLPTTLLRPGSGEITARPQSIARPGEDDHYDYISAYTDEPANEGGSHPGSTGGYGEGQFATNLENGSR